jgi:predicted AlkP superfamily pyrophosphatase or phosphodiesterase
MLLLPFVPYSEPRPVAERVLIISIDGLRPEGIYNAKTDKANAPFIFSLSQQGAVDWGAQTVTPSTTLPGHASMLSGYDVPKHGVDIGSYRDLLKRDPYFQVPTIFDYAQDFGLRTVMVAGKQKMNYFNRPDTLDVFHTFNEKSDEDRFDPDIASRARKIMRDGFGVMLIHFPDTDSAGHLDRWLSKPYMGTVRRVDKSIKSIFEKLESLGLLETTLVILTADHAGDDWGHMGSGPREKTIPWIIVGPSVRPGTSLFDIDIFDTAATALWALGIRLPPDLDGRVVREAFQ